MSTLKTFNFQLEKDKFGGSIPFIEKKHNIKILLAFVRGSHMYGTATDKSDVDITFVYQQPTTEILKLNYVPYIDVSGTGDVVGHEIQKFIDLLSENNPTMLETMDIPEDCLIYKNPIMDELLDQKLWLSKLTKNTILGYGKSQIGKATGLNKNMNNPQPEKRKSILEFCYVIEEDKTIHFMDFIRDYKVLYNHLEPEFLDHNNWGLSKLQNGKQLYTLYPNLRGETLRGLVKDENSTQLRVSEIPKVLERPVYTLIYNLDGFEVHCKSWAAYKKWEKEKNEERHKTNVAHGKNYDSKNMMHLFRLLEMALMISQGKGLKVKSENIPFLLDIKQGKYEYDYLMSEAELLTNEIKNNFEVCDLQEIPDLGRSKELLLKFRMS